MYSISLTRSSNDLMGAVQSTSKILILTNFWS
jgi:hypothetical protein